MAIFEVSSPKGPYFLFHLCSKFLSCYIPMRVMSWLRFVLTMTAPYSCKRHTDRNNWNSHAAQTFFIAFVLWRVSINLVNNIIGHQTPSPKKRRACLIFGSCDQEVPRQHVRVKIYCFDNGKHNNPNDSTDKYVKLCQVPAWCTRTNELRSTVLINPRNSRNNTKN